MRVKMHLVFFLLLMLHLNLAADESPSSEINRYLDSYISFTHPQKVYLHLDKTSYQANQTIWFKAYLMDGVRHVPDTTRSNLYVDLINSEGNTAEIRLLLSEGGFAKGDIQLRSNLPEGNYIIRAYTDWMRNFGEEYYFTQHLYISNPEYENMIPRIDILKNRLFNRRIRRMDNDYQLHFFPEGGNLVEGINCRVAFQVIDRLGRGQDAEGDIIDENGAIIASLETDLPGIGVFEIEPQDGTSYRARISVNGERSVNYPFPDAIEKGYSLRIDQNEEWINASIISSLGPDNPLYSDEIILVAHTRGVSRFTNTYRLRKGRVDINIDKNLFPSGISHFTIFTRKHIPVAERLVFIDSGDEIIFTPDIAQTGNADYFDMQIKITDHNGEPVKGGFSLSAITGEPDPSLHDIDILTYMLINSDLKGVIEYPHMYLRQPSDRQNETDLLLMTYGWRRFDWNAVLSEELPEIKYDLQPGISVGGQLIDPAKNYALSNYPVQLKILNNDPEVFNTRTSRDGRFVFKDLFYEGAVRMELHSHRLPANHPPVFKLNIHDGSDFDYVPGIYTREYRITRIGDDWKRVRGVSASPYRSSPDRRHVNPQIYGVPDQTIYIDYETLTESSLWQVLRNRATSLSFDHGKIIIRGRTSLLLDNEARFMLDGMFVNRDIFLNLYPKEVERIEIFKGTSTAVFGTRGGTGVIAAYTRRPGYKGLEDAMELTVQGYHTPHEFYSDLVSIPGISFNENAVKTVYWKPDLFSDENGIINLHLPIYQEAHKLLFTIEGAGYEGGLGFSEFIFDIE